MQKKSEANQIDYVEFPARTIAELARTKVFFKDVFGWSYQDWGDDYSDTQDSGLGSGINADPEHRPSHTLAVIYAADLESVRAKVVAAGGKITKDIFGFPGGRRFHFKEPSGSELAVWSGEPRQTDIEKLAQDVGRLLKEKKATLAIAESCTGGLISHCITQIAGSSEYFLFSATTYSNASKISVLGVSEESLRQFGAVHEEIVRQMADGVKRVAGADYAISTSGIAGPEGGSPEKPVGTVCIGISTPHGTDGFRYCFSNNSRERNKEVFALTALETLYQSLIRE